MNSRRVQVAFGVGDLVTAGVVALGVFAGLPSRWAVVDVPAALLVVLHLGSAAGLLANKAWAPRAAKVASAASLALGLLVITALTLTAGWLSGIYGPVGRGGAVILALVAALAVPYLVAIPVARLVWLRGARA
jgi:hypothetical protein